MSDWQLEALCRTTGEPDDWGDVDSRTPAERLTFPLSVCEACPVRAQCAEAGRNEEFGIWGGTLPEERQRQRFFEFFGYETVTWSPYDLEGFIDRYINKQESVRALALEYSVARMTLVGFIERTGLREKRERAFREKLAAIIEDRAEGMTYEAIAEKYGYASHSSITHLLSTYQAA